VLARVLTERCYLDAALTEVASDDPALVQELSYGTLRWFHTLVALARQLLRKPLKARDQDVYALLLLGLYQLRAMRVAPHAAVDETVAAAGALGKGWARGLINACLRGYLRDRERLEQRVATEDAARYAHPPWLMERLRQTYPDDWASILDANNARPPLTLRVNLARGTRADYLAQLQAAGLGARATTLGDSGVVLTTPVAVAALPGFAEGRVSVQDAAAQQAAPLLELAPGQRVLDACAAPGGKTAQLLECCPAADVTALDIDAVRVARIHDTLRRLKLTARVLTADALDVAVWWDGRAFDRILLDAPCSASGVIRRHPDIKLRRQPADLVKLAATQARLLDALWPTLTPGGKLLYVTCSCLPDENEQQIAAFLARRPDAMEEPLALGAGRARRHGWQCLPGEADGDGFYYARLAKAAT
jgi:16S rRNA (cytosine967-C5)-methyltransferase